MAMHQLLGGIKALIARTADVRPCVYVAIGDSFTEGVGDDPRRARSGWAGRVADILEAHVSRLEYVNFAASGKLANEILAEQLDSALELCPDLITVAAGGNDLILPRANPELVLKSVEA